MRCAAAVAVGMVCMGAAHGEIVLPAAPVRVIINDARAFDAALGGRFRAALTGNLPDGDPVAAAWRQTTVGSKLAQQWELLSDDVSLTWSEIMLLHPRKVGLALLDAGDLEAVLVVETDATNLLPLPVGQTFTRGDVEVHLVREGAGDGDRGGERRLGLAWARRPGQLLVASSLRALDLTLGAGPDDDAVMLPGLVSVALDMDRLRDDFYFKREFIGAANASGVIRAALIVRDGDLVEIRQGTEEQGADAAAVFVIGDAAAAGWVNDDGLWRALHAGLLEPVSGPPLRPLPSVVPLPSVSESQVDPYLVNFEKHSVATGAAMGEEGELADWQRLLRSHAVEGWGYAVSSDQARAIVFEWPASAQREFEDLCYRTLLRRSGGVSIVRNDDVVVYRVGPALTTIALRRVGDYLWVGNSEELVRAAPEPETEADLVRWASLDLDAVRSLEDAIGRYGTRPITDRIFGLLDWLPVTSRIEVKRSRTGHGWRESVVFATERD